MTGPVDFGNSPPLESMLTFSTWQGGFSAADKQAMKDAIAKLKGTQRRSPRYILAAVEDAVTDECDCCPEFEE